MASYSRLDDRSVEDPIIRTYLHQEIIAQSQRYDDSTNFTYEVKPDEKYRPDLLAFRAWGTSDMRWVPTVIAGLESETDPLPVGTELTLPSAAFVSDRVRHYTDNPEIES